MAIRNPLDAWPEGREAPVPSLWPIQSLDRTPLKVLETTPTED